MIMEVINICICTVQSLIIYSRYLQIWSTMWQLRNLLSEQLKIEKSAINEWLIIDCMQSMQNTQSVFKMHNWKKEGTTHHLYCLNSCTCWRSNWWSWATVCLPKATAQDASWLALDCAFHHHWQLQQNILWHVQHTHGTIFALLGQFSECGHWHHQLAEPFW